MDLPIPTAWTTQWATDAARDYGTYTVSGALALTALTTGSNYGGSATCTLIADGVHVPTLNGVPSPNYINLIGTANLVSLVNVGGTLCWSVGVTVPGASLLPTWTSAPVISGATVGVAATVTTPATNATSFAYQWSEAGAAVATSSTYAPATAGDVVSCVVTAINANGTTPDQSNSVTVQIVNLLTFATVGSGIAIGQQGGYSTYAPATGSWTQTLCYNASKKLPGNPPADVWWSATAEISSAVLMAGLDTANGVADGIYEANPAAFEVYSNSSTYTAYNYPGSVTKTVLATYAPADGDTVRWRRNASNAIYFEVLPTGQSSWTSLYLFTGYGTADLYPRLQYGNAATGAIGVVMCNGGFA